MQPRRLGRGLVLVAALLVPLACSGARRGGAGHGTCQTRTWGGWDGTPQCAGLAANLLVSEDRGCGNDADCALVGVTTCGAHAVNKSAFSRYASLPAPCAHPLAGMCAPVNHRPVCEAGCCVASAATQPYGH